MEIVIALRVVSKQICINAHITWGHAILNLWRDCMIRLIFAFCDTYTGNYKYRNIYINLEHVLFTNNANNDVNRYKIYLFWYVNTYNLKRLSTEVD